MLAESRPGRSGVLPSRAWVAWTVSERHNNRMQLTRSAPLQGRLAPPSQLIRVFDRQQ